MGNEINGYRNHEEFLSEYQEIRRESNLQFGSVILFQHQKNHKLQLIMKEKMLFSTEEANKFLERCEKQSEIKGNNIAPLLETVGTSSVTQLQSCSSLALPTTNACLDSSTTSERSKS